MAEMHPHRRAQLELETAEQAARGSPVQKIAAELDAEADLMRSAATGENSISVGGQRKMPMVHNTMPSTGSTLQRPRAMQPHSMFFETQAMQAPNFESFATSVPRMPRSVKKMMNEREALLRATFMKADQAGNLDLAQDCHDELATIKASCSAYSAAKMNDPQRLARRARKKTARLWRSDIAMAKGTYATPRERRANKETEHEAGRHADPVWAAQETEIEQARKMKKEEKKSIDQVVARYATGRMQQSDQNILYQHTRSEQRQQSTISIIEQGPQSVRDVVKKGEQGDLQASYHSDAQPHFRIQYDDYQAERPYEQRYYEAQQDAIGEDHQQMLLAHYEGSPWNPSRKWERLNADEQFSDATSSDDDSDSHMGGVSLPLMHNFHYEASSGLRPFSPSPKFADGQKINEELDNVADQPRHFHQPETWGSPKPETDLAGKRQQDTRCMHGDGSKPFLDPESTAYKMMSRMGWSQGRDLGRDGAGIPDVIKVPLKKDRMGLQTRAMASPVREAHQCVSNGATRSHSIPRSVPTAKFARRNGSHAPVHDIRHTMIDLTQDEKEDQDMNPGPVFIDLTQDIFVDLTLDDDDGNDDADVDSNGSLPMDIRSPDVINPEQHRVADAAPRRSASNGSTTTEATAAQNTSEVPAMATKDDQTDVLPHVAEYRSLSRGA